MGTSSSTCVEVSVARSNASVEVFVVSITVEFCGDDITFEMVFSLLLNFFIFSSVIGSLISIPISFTSCSNLLVNCSLFYQSFIFSFISSFDTCSYIDQTPSSDSVAGLSCISSRVYVSINIRCSTPVVLSFTKVIAPTLG